jgi:uracil phosphoribosyltransferase
MHIHYISEQNSILNHFLAQIRDVTIQKDSMRFRKNIERIGEIMAYELSKTLDYKEINVQTPLGIKNTTTVAEPVVLCSILRAGLALHTGFMNFFDNAENGFVSAYRHHYDNDDKFDILVEYQAAPSFEGKNLILIDPNFIWNKNLKKYTLLLSSLLLKELNIYKKIFQKIVIFGLRPWMKN